MIKVAVVDLKLNGEYCQYSYQWEVTEEHAEILKVYELKDEDELHRLSRAIKKVPGRSLVVLNLTEDVGPLIEKALKEVDKEIEQEKARSAKAKKAAATRKKNKIKKIATELGISIEEVEKMMEKK